MPKNGTTLLIVNAGSSSVRLAWFSLQDSGVHALDSTRIDTPTQDLADILTAYINTSGLSPAFIAHRIVHGGSEFTEPCVIDSAVEAQIETLSSLAPLHNPVALQWIRTCRNVLGDTVHQIALFDTAYFSRLPAVAARYAIPSSLAKKHQLRRFGFHGIAHRGMWRRLQKMHANAKKVITVQLGSGCSVTAINHGVAIDTSMGFSPLEGLVMATRCGDIDPGLLLYLLHTLGMSAQQVDDVLNNQSGLKGLAGHDGDMRTLLNSKEASAKLAIEIYCYRIRKYIGAYMAVLNGVDAIVFGGGVGEHSAEIRARVVEHMDQLGIVLDDNRNRSADGNDTCISNDSSNVKLWVLPVDEALEMAEDTATLLTRKGG